MPSKHAAMGFIKIPPKMASPTKVASHKKKTKKTKKMRPTTNETSVLHNNRRKKKEKLRTYEPAPAGN